MSLFPKISAVPCREGRKKKVNEDVSKFGNNDLRAMKVILLLELVLSKKLCKFSYLIMEYFFKEVKRMMNCC